jgi:retron-type reverse transcriptase
MTIDPQGSVGASSTEGQDWKSLPWDTFRQEVRRLQMRMAKAIKEKHYGKARALQWILTHSRAAKFLAIQRVTTNKGHRTPGIDNKVWRTDQQKLAAIALLRRRGYKPQPLRRIYISSHPWMLENIPMDRRILEQWLKAGFVENRRLFPTTAGTPQGGIASPVLANLTLDGLEGTIRASINSQHDKVNFLRYADDFIVTGATKEILEQKVKPAIIEFLGERGLKLSEQKTVITPITEGFDFLGQNVRKYGQKLLIKPTRQSVRSVLEKARQRIKSCHGHTAADLIHQLNPLLRGWANYHRHVVSKRIFGRVDYYVYGMLWRWARREHRDKSDGWIRQRYFSADPKGAFSIRTQDRQGQEQVLKVYRLAETVIERHIKVRGAANPYDPADVEYFEKRRCFAWRTYPLGNPRTVSAGKG